jgi:exodeoxyribonuclease VII small subunit
MAPRRDAAPAGAKPVVAEADATESFDETLARLDGIVAQLDGGESSLEDSLASFEQGVSLVRRCARTLGAAERRIELLTAGMDGAERSVLDAGEIADED